MGKCFQRHRVQESIAGDLPVLLCNNVAACFRKLSDFLLESLFALIYAVENEQARGQRGFFLRRNENERVV